MSEELIKIMAVILISAIFITVIKNKLAEYSFLLLIAVICIVLMISFDNVFGAFSSLNALFTKSGTNSKTYFTVALKALGISYITNFSADLCRDYGLSALAQSAETVGKVTIFALSIPLMESVLSAALKFAGI